MNPFGTGRTKPADLPTAIWQSALSEACTYVRQLALPRGGQHVVHQGGQVPPGHLVPAEVPERSLLWRKSHVPPAVCISAAAGSRLGVSRKCSAGALLFRPSKGRSTKCICAAWDTADIHAAIPHDVILSVRNVPFPYGGLSPA